MKGARTKRVVMRVAVMRGINQKRMSSEAGVKVRTKEVGRNALRLRRCGVDEQARCDESGCGG